MRLGLAAFILLLLTATSLVIRDAWFARRTSPRAAEFQSLVGGIGLGGELGLARCEMAFDPRLDDECRAARFPLPCGDSFCPCHGLAVFRLSPLHANQRPSVEVQWDAGLD